MAEPALKNVADVYPMSPTQAGMVFHTLASPAGDLYTVQVVYSLEGRVDPEILAAAWQRLVDRHDILRTALVWEGMERPLQVVRTGGAVDFRTVDLPPGDGAAAEIEAFLERDRAAGFDLAAAPSFRIALLRAGAGSATMVWSFHHALLDGWSAQLVVNELLETYEAVASGGNGVAPERRPFRDYIAWLGQRDAAADRTFWSRELAGFTNPTSLPADRALQGGPGAAMRHCTTTRALPVELTSRARSFCRANRVTLSTLIHGAWSLVLARYTGGRDVVFGATSSGRPASLPGAESMLGMFLTTVPHRIRVDPAAELAGWLQTVQSHRMDVEAHEHAPLVDIHRWSDVPAGSRLFDTIVVVENIPHRRAAARIRVAATRYLDNSNFPLALIVSPGEALEIKVVSDREAFEPATIEALVDRLAALLDRMVDRPGAALGELSVLTAAELDLIGDWNDTAAELPEQGLVPDMIGAAAAASPGRVAVACGDESLTYGELWSRAAALADELRRHGAGPGEFVGIHLDRSVELIVAIAGVLAAGAAYVPLDPAYPEERLRFMIEDSGASLIVTSRAAGLPGAGEPAAALPGGMVLVSTGMPGPGAGGGRSAATAGDLAYMIYTSGSTGRPNGVLIDHGNLLASTQARIAYYDEPPRSFLLLSSFSFDSSVVGIFWTLATGGTLVLPRPGEELDVQALVKLIAGEQVTHTLCLPSLYRLLLDYGDAAALGSLTTVIVAGEACPPDLVGRHAEVLPGAALFNEYGPTEASVWCTVHRCDDTDGPERLPIGHPIANTQAVLLDGDGRLVPVGLPGEIHVGGPGLSRGYHNRPELTAGRFVEVPSAELPATVAAPGETTRLLRTGDVGRYRRDGAIEFLGRADDQVKIRGFRVELGEVEAVLRRHPAVAEAAVLAAGDGDRLAAFVTTTAPVAPARLQEFAANRLPAHMVPGTVTAVDELPHLPNGKVDRSALQALELPAPAAHHVAPRDPLERQIAAIWAELLPETTIGAHDDFFMLGGHSLLAVALVEKIRKATGRQLRLTDLLDAPTVAGQAELLRADERPPEDRATIVALKPDGALPRLYLVPPARGTALSFLALARHLPPEQPLFVFEPLGTDRFTSPQASIPEMAERYVADLRSEQPAGPYRIGGSCMGAHVAWEIAHQLRAQGETVESVVAIDAEAPYNGPGWTTLPPPPSRRRTIENGIRHVFRGSLAAAIRRRRRARRLDRDFRGLLTAHIAAQRSYQAPPLDVDLLLVQSAETAAELLSLRRWRSLTSSRLEQAVVPHSTHRSLRRRVRDVAAIIHGHLAALGTPTPTSEDGGAR